MVQEHVDPRPLVHAEIAREIISDERKPWDGPSHPLAIGDDQVLWRGRDEGERCIPRGQVRWMSNAVGKHRAAPACARWPVRDAGLVEKTIKNQLSSTSEQVGQA